MDKTGLAKPQAAPAEAARMDAAQAGAAPGRRLVRGRPFPKGQSGNPAGRPAGARNRSTLAAARLLDGEAEALTRKAVELALAGDALALKLCLERILPPCRERAVRFALPAIDNAADVAAAMKAVAAAIAAGALTPGEGETMARILAGCLPAIEADDLRRRVEAPLSPEDEEMLGRLAGLLGDLQPKRGF